MHNSSKIGAAAAADPQETAIAVLSWLANEPDMLSRFLALTGVAPGELRHAMGDTGFLAGLIDFIMGHEPTLMAFCAATDTAPETVAAAWRTLSKPGLDSGEY
ncbi:DUF3572 domain-containing protein [Metarhizobium album]|uniref:DUF3572 domain-containing protein n=1 Tax=Metarhizobium album TaxID=2182425 RepID=A0A2U2DHT7_9HYPH|nr:DUF3572 domain-containing protein [Rhizobium album]OJT95868.1 MAG: hypothetical protein BGN83_05335 [Rhizobium sp. 63-7]PWE52844.1 DUF3572 domain-containing protein [Rhizobium album]